MPPQDLTRRAFLAASGGLLLAAACGGSKGGSTGGGSAKGFAALMLASDLYASPTPQRLAFALADAGRYASGLPARIALGPQGRPRGEFIDTTLHDRGLPRARGIYTVDVPLPQAGVWESTIEVKGNRVPLAFQVQPVAKGPIPGQPAPRAASPTLADPLGVDPLCTRNPPCPLHQVSLDRVLAAGKPVAVMFATPARCESRYCGPVLDDLLTLRRGYGDRITFVHIEIYKALTGTDLVPTVEAWGIQSEPWLFGVDVNGTVVSRIDGAFGADEQKQLLDALAA